MNETDKLRTIAITQETKTQLRTILEKYASEVSQLYQSNDDPHSPIVGLMQLAFVQAATEYMITSGCKPSEAVNIVCQITQKAMNTWLGSLMKKAT